MAQLVKNRPAMQDTEVQSLGWEDLLEKGMATYCSILFFLIVQLFLFLFFFFAVFRQFFFLFFFLTLNLFILIRG